jgi:hypothetical protein
MSAPIKLNFKIYQGSTFRQVLRWESSTKVYVPITNISKSAPVVLTAPAHGVPVGWRARVTNSNVKELVALDYMTVTGTTTDTVTFNQVNSLAFTTYTSGGVLEYNAPVPVSTYTARMQIREKLSSTAIIYELTTANNGIVIDNVLKTITLYIPPAATTAFNFTSAVYSLELVANSEVVPFASGSISLQYEVTR